MNVAGAGVGSGAIVIFIMLSANPLLIIALLRNLGLFSSIGKSQRRILYVCCFILIFGVECLAMPAFKEGAIPGLFFITIYCLAVTGLSFLLRLPLQKVWKQARWILAILSVISFTTIYVLTKPTPPYVNPLIEKQLVKALQLKMIIADSLLNGFRLQIKDDTISGYYKDYLFARSLRDLNFRKTVREGRNPYYYKYANGYFYSGGRHSGDEIRKTDSDTTEIFVYRSAIPTERYFIYKNLSIFSGASSLYPDSFIVYDEAREKILRKDAGRCIYELVGDKLIYYESQNTEDGFTLSGFSLDKMELLWQHRFNEGYFRLNFWPHEPQYVDPVHAGKHIALASKDSIYLVDVVSGKTTWKYPLPDTSYRSQLRYLFDDEHCYLNSGARLKCINIVSSKIKWETSASLIGINKDRIIVSTLDETKIGIINKESGQVEHIFQNSEFNEIRFLGKYILLPHKGSTALYE